MNESNDTPPLPHDDTNTPSRNLEDSNQNSCVPPNNTNVTNWVDVLSEGESGDDDATEIDMTSSGTSRDKSEVWKHFTKIPGTAQASCNYCSKKMMAASKNGTSSLKKHIKTCPKRRNQDIKQSFLNASNRGGKTNIEVYNFDQGASRECLGKMIIMHEYPLSIVEHQGFRVFCNSLQPMFKPVSRNTIKADIMRIYEHEKCKTMEMLNKNSIRFSITTDMWTSSNKKRGFMAVTAYFIDDSWVLQSRIVRFIYVPCPHTAEVLSETLMEVLLDWNLDRKLTTLTLDNCSTNDAMVNILLENKISSNCLLVGGQFFHMRCSAHILNLIVGAGLNVIHGGIEKVRDSVVYWTATPKRCETFEKNCHQLKIPCTKKLSLDCKTRWNSTYLILQGVLPFKDAFARLKQRDSQYKCLPSQEEWELANEICNRLKLFYEATELFSGTRYPTINLFFPKIICIKLSMNDWELSTYDEVREMGRHMRTKFEKYWNLVHGVMALGTIFDPRYKMRGIEYMFSRLFGSGASDEIAKVRKLSFDVLREYQEDGTSVNCSLGKATSSSMTLSHSQPNKRIHFESEIDMYISNINPNDVAKCELDYYLEEACIPRVDDFDILARWKSNGPKYPNLNRVARDILAIPGSTVASESAFSTSGRFLSPHRSRLHPNTLEALMCAQNWLWTEVQGQYVSQLRWKDVQLMMIVMTDDT